MSSEFVEEERPGCLFNDGLPAILPRRHWSFWENLIHSSLIHCEAVDVAVDRRSSIPVLKDGDDEAHSTAPVVTCSYD